MRAKITLVEDKYVLIFPDWENVKDGPVYLMDKSNPAGTTLRKDNDFIFREMSRIWGPACSCCVDIDEIDCPCKGTSGEEMFHAAKIFVKGRVHYEGSGGPLLSVQEVDETPELDIQEWWYATGSSQG